MNKFQTDKTIKNDFLHQLLKNSIDLFGESHAWIAVNL